jgi:hypothetical protein
MDIMSHIKVMITMILGVIALLLFYVFVVKGESFGEWKKTTGKGSLASAALGIAVIVGSAIGLTLLFSPKASASDMFGDWTWNNGVYTYIGIDYTKGVSPQCVEGGADDRATSNMGFGWQAGRSADKRHELNAKTTHHSCVLGKDRNGYDSLFGLEYRYWIYRN